MTEVRFLFVNLVNLAHECNGKVSQIKMSVVAELEVYTYRSIFTTVLWIKIAVKIGSTFDH